MLLNDYQQSLILLILPDITVKKRAMRLRVARLSSSLFQAVQSLSFATYNHRRRSLGNNRNPEGQTDYKKKLLSLLLFSQKNHFDHCFCADFFNVFCRDIHVYRLMKSRDLRVVGWWVCAARREPLS